MENTQNFNPQEDSFIDDIEKELEFNDDGEFKLIEIGNEQQKYVTIPCFKFDELSKATQNSVYYKIVEYILDDDWYSSIYDEAKSMGLVISSFDIYDKSIEVKMISSLKSIMHNIMCLYGSDEKLMNIYHKHKALIDKLESETIQANSDKDADEIINKFHNIEISFVNDMKQYFYVMLENEYDYITSMEHVKSFIENNNLIFSKKGYIINHII